MLFTIFSNNDIFIDYKGLFCLQKIPNPLGLFRPKTNWRDLIFLAKIIG